MNLTAKNKFELKLKEFLNHNKLWNLLCQNYSKPVKGSKEYAILQLIVNQIQLAIKYQNNWAIQGTAIVKAVNCDNSYVYKILHKFGNQIGIEQIENEIIRSKNLLNISKKLKKQFKDFKIKHSKKTWMFIFKQKIIDKFNKFLNLKNYININNLYLSKTKIYKKIQKKLAIEYYKNHNLNDPPDDEDWIKEWEKLSSEWS